MRILLLLSICWAGAAFAQDAVPSAAERQALREKALALRTQASDMRGEAERTLVAETKACWKKFLVTRCQDNAKLAKQEKLAAAREIEGTAREIERSLRKVEFAEREARLAEEGPQRAAENAARAEKNRLEQQEALQRVEQKRLEAEQRDKR
jgi:hypothetical protein